MHLLMAPLAKKVSVNLVMQAQALMTTQAIMACERSPDVPFFPPGLPANLPHLPHTARTGSAHCASFRSQAF